MNADERVFDLARRGTARERRRRDQARPRRTAVPGARDMTTNVTLLDRLTVAGHPRHLSAVRRFTAQALGPGTDSTDTAVLLVSELVANALAHSRSGGDGGTVTITLLGIPDGIRAEVTDQGGATTPAVQHPNPELDEHGRGLELITALATRWGHHNNPAGTLTWFELAIPPPAGPHSPQTPHQQEAT